ncbi:MAG: hypothetical protein HKN26_05310 [Acidimicrobiales bacterium]|nr:hypothetical protein [Acidimicrobiales bacterium]
MKRLSAVVFVVLGLVAVGCAGDDVLVSVGDTDVTREEAATVLDSQILQLTTAEQLTQLLPEQAQQVVQNDDANLLVFYGYVMNALADAGGAVEEEDRLNAAALLEGSANGGDVELVAAQLALAYQVTGLPRPAGEPAERAAAVNAVAQNQLGPAIQQSIAAQAQVDVTVDPSLGEWNPQLQLLLPAALS